MEKQPPQRLIFPFIALMADWDLPFLSPQSQSPLLSLRGIEYGAIWGDCLSQYLIIYRTPFTRRCGPGFMRGRRRESTRRVNQYTSLNLGRLPSVVQHMSEVWRLHHQSVADSRYCGLLSKDDLLLVGRVGARPI